MTLKFIPIDEDLEFKNIALELKKTKGKQMPRGRPCKLTQQNILEGNTQKISKKEFQAKLSNTGLKAFGEVFTVDYIPEDAKYAVQMIKDSMPPGVYCTLDGFLITTYAVAYAVNKLATQQLFGGNPSDNFIAYNEKTGGESLSGWYRVYESSARLISSMGAQLGLDPRARMAMTNPNTTPTDEDGLLGNAAHN